MSPSTNRPGNTVTRGISLPRSLDRRLVAQAWREDRSVSALLRRALLKYLARAESGPKEKLAPGSTFTAGPSAAFGWGRSEAGDEGNEGYEGDDEL